jgi:hypothetical protein
MMSAGNSTALFATASKKSPVNWDKLPDWMDGFPIYAPNPMK